MGKMKGVGFLDIIRYIGYIPTLASAIMAIVAFVEGVMEAAPGAEKKEAVLTSLEASWATIVSEFGVERTFSDLKPLIGLLIDLCVSIYNLFWKPAPAPVV